MAKVKVQRSNKRHVKRATKDATTVEHHQQQNEALTSSAWTIWMGRTATFVPILAAMIAWPIYLKSHQFASNNVSSASSSSSNWNDTNLFEQEQQQLQAPMMACNLVMAESTIPSAGWGVYTLQDLEPGSAELDGGGGVVIPIPDLLQHHLDLGMAFLLHSYAWSSEITGGSTEGTVVYSAMPGIGFLANGDSQSYNLLPYQAKHHHGGTPRDTSPGAGASSYYQNFSFVPSKPIRAGDEIFMDYGRGWDAKLSQQSSTTITRHRPKRWLRDHGMCIDHLRPGLSTIPHAGHGAFASRFLPRGTMIAPAPLLPIAHRQSLQFVSHDGEQRQQLLVNYCVGHPNSTLLFLPYSPMVALINHSNKRPNAVLRWSPREIRRNYLSREDISTTSGLLMEVVATRDIAKGEEVLIDYGERWQRAWDQHVSNWKRKRTTSSYKYAHDLNQVQLLHTEVEQQATPYPDNLQTSCYFHRDRAMLQTTGSESDPMLLANTIRFQWQHFDDVFHPSRLRPCHILERTGRGGANVHDSYYTVEIANRKGLPQSDHVPHHERWVVTRVPREAIQFTDKPYSSDQFLTNAFRHEIGIPDEQFPQHWMDQR